MKKYLLTSILGLFAFVGFTNANTIGDFTSQNIIGEYNFEQGFYLGDLDYESLNCGENCNELYFCVDTNDTNYEISYYDSSDNSISLENITNNPYCANVPTTVGDNNIDFYEEDNYEKIISGKLYFSISPITIQNISGGGSTEEDGIGTILSGGFAQLSPIVDGVGTIVKEFIPYVVYISIGLLLATLGFIAIKWLMNLMSNKIVGTFSSRRRK